MERQLRMGGGIMNAVPREQYGLGSFLKKGFNKLKGGVKKIAKSPFGKAAALYFGGNLLQGNFGGPFSGFTNPFTSFQNPLKGQITDGIGSFFRGTIGDKAVDKIVKEGGDELFGMGKSFLVGSLLPSVLGGDDGDGGGYQRDIPALRANLTESYRNQRTFSDEEDEEAAIAAQVEQDIAGFQQDMNRTNYAIGSDPEQNAIKAAGIMNLPLNQNPAGVTELDLRETGGFIPPVGVKEKADDIPAMLSNNEFVFTAKSVKEMGDGDVNRGAQRMYDMMKYLEKGGRV
jgi:hypothetical protein